jgi:hypothetical protein
MEGYIGKLNYNTWMKFCQLMNSNEDQDQKKKRYDSFEHISQTHCEKIYAKVKAVWTKEITYDDTLYLDF